MSLSCSCDSDWDGDGWFYMAPDDYTFLKSERRKRCCSCKNLIELQAICIEFCRYREPLDDIEIRIYDEDGHIRIGSWYMCEECSDLYFSLEALGFCILLGESMHDLVKEYHDTYGSDVDIDTL